MTHHVSIFWRKDMNHKKNKHYLETEQKLQATTLQIISEQKVPTVAEICRRCHINRTTFYLHYTDIVALMNKLQQTIFNEFNEHSEALGNITLMSYESFLLFAEHVKKNKDFYKLYFGINKSFPLKDGFDILWENTILPYYHAQNITDEKIIFYRFVCIQAGFTITLGKWVEEDCNLEASQIATILSECLSL